MKLLDIVALVEDVPEFKLYRGQIGTIVEEYEPDVFEVEFSDTKGRTYALETLKASQLKAMRMRFNLKIIINKTSYMDVKGKF